MAGTLAIRGRHAAHNLTAKMVLHETNLRRKLYSL